MATADPEYSLEELYQETVRRGLLKDNPELQELGHELRRRKMITDPTQGGLFPERAPGYQPPAPSAPSVGRAPPLLPPSTDTSTLRAPYPSRLAAHLGPNVDFTGMHPDAQQALTRALDEAKQRGIPVTPTITSARRSREKQARLHAAYKAGKAKYPAAPPGVSRHERGEAFDIDIPDEHRGTFTQIMESHGFRWGGRFRKPDPVHYEWAGAPAAARPAAKAAPVALQAPTIAPFSFPRIPAEAAHAQARAAMQKIPAWQRVRLRPFVTRTAAELRAAEEGRLLTPAESGPIHAVEEQERSAFASVVSALPEIDRQIRGAGIQLQRDAETLAAARKHYEAAVKTHNAGRRDPANAQRLRALGAQLHLQAQAFARNQQMLDRRAAEREEYGRRGEAYARSGKPLHTGMSYAEERGGSTVANELYGQFARSWMGKGAEFLNPAGFLTESIRRTLPQAQAALMASGAYPALPAIPPSTPEQRARLIGEKNELLLAVAVLGDAVRPDGTLAKTVATRARRVPVDQPDPFGLSMNPADAVADAAQVIRRMTPWQRQLLPVMLKQFAAERAAVRIAGIGQAFLKDWVSNLTGGVVGGAVGKKVAAKVAARVAPILADEGVSVGALRLLTKPSLPLSVGRALLRPLPTVLSGAAGGGAGAAAAIGSVTLAETRDPRAAAAAALEAGRMGAVAGGLFSAAALFGGAPAALQRYAQGRTEQSAARFARDLIQKYGIPGREFGKIRDALIDASKLDPEARSARLSQVADELRRRYQKALPEPEAPGGVSGAAPEPAAPAGLPPETLEGMARVAREAGDEPRAREFETRAAQARGQRPTLTAEPALEIPDAPVRTEPLARFSDGTEIPLRMTSEADLRAAQERAQAAGDAGAAGAIGAWVGRHEAWSNAHAVVHSQEDARDYVKAWENLREPRRRQWQVLNTAAERAQAAGNSVLAEKLTRAASDAQQTFGREWLESRGGEAGMPPNPMASVWRQLTPEERAGLPEAVQRQLLVQDLENSVTVLGRAVDPAIGKRETTEALSQRADAAFREAQQRLVDETLALHLPALPIAGGGMAGGEEGILQPEGSGVPTAGEPAGAPGMAPGVPETEGAGIPLVAPLEQPTGIPGELPGPRQAPTVASEVPVPTSIGAPAVEPKVKGSATDKSVRDLGQKAVIDGDVIRVTSFVGRQKAGEYSIPLSEWKLADREPTANPNYNRAELVRKYTAHLDDEPGGPGQAERIRDSQVRAILKALEVPAAQAGITKPKAKPEPKKKRGAAVKEREPASIPTEEEVKPEAPAFAGPERRVDLGRRKKVAEMTPEERATALLTDDLTGLGNRRGYEEGEKRAWQASIDADSLKWWNDTFGHPAGDALLRAIGAALKESGADAYHISGDEFVAQADDEALLRAALDRADDLLTNGRITVTVGGKKRTFAGLGMSYAIAERNEEAEDRPAYADADELLKEVKERREAEGLRVPRGERPSRFAEVGAGEPEGRGERGVPAGEREGVPSEPEAEVTDPRVVFDRAKHLVIALAAMIDEGKAPKTNPQLMAWFADQGFSVTAGGVQPDFVYDVLEAAVNLAILNRPSLKDTPVLALGVLRDIVRELPTQNLRTEGKRELQQFSTPPTLAYVAVRAAAPRAGDVVLEPSAGTGSLAAMVKNLEPVTRVHTNEIDPRRQALLEILGFPVTSGDAERIDSTLPPAIKPTLVVMNPPFSATGGRVTQHKNEFGYRHVRSAMERLEPGGRLVAILGGGAALGKKNAAPFWKAMMGEYDVRAVIELPGEEYAKYGTTFDNVIAVIDKRPASGQPIIKGKVESLEEALELLSQAPRPGAEVTDEAIRAAAEGGRPTGERGEADALGVGPGAAGPAAQPRGRRAGVRGERGAVPAGEERAREPGAARGAAGLRGAEPAPELAEAPPGRPVRGGAGAAPSVPAEPVARPARAPKPQRQESEQSVFERYEPAHLKEGKPHPAPIVETKAMAAVAPPPVSYQHHVPKAVVESGAISGAQLEAVVYNGQAQQTFSATGHRHGFLVGDGTGTGKTRTLAAIVADNWNQGRKRAVWVTAQKNTAPEIRDALNLVGLKDASLTEAGEFKGGAPIPIEEGVLYLTYQSLIRPVKGGRFDGRQRWEQLAAWLGEDGVLLFDESHAMKSGVTEGMKKPSKTALAGIEFQEKHPKIRVTYASATGATDVANLAYMTRLGLWGPGTAFPGGFAEFLQQVGTAGVGAMELAAQNMKALGKYTARSISYEGVEYTEVTHGLTAEQRRMYDTSAEAWRAIFDGFDRGWQTVIGDQKQKKKFERRNLYGDQQRFFRLLLSALKMPTTIKTIEERLATGHSVVVSLTNTNEATEKRLVTRAVAEEADLEEMDFSPRELLANLVETRFPVQNVTEYEDENGNVVMRPVWNADGTPEINPAAVRQRDALLERLGGIYLPENPLDQILFHFGHEAVAELSGRSHRRRRDPKTGKMERAPRKAPDGSSKGVNLVEMAWFQGGKKRIAVITPAADTGISLHASYEAKNQQRRVHILHELPWSADRALQGMGRTHRTNQASAPEVILVSSDVGGEKRFAATIARRLASLGALTRGHRGASGAGELAKYNFETEYGKAAIELLMNDVATGRLKDPALGDVEQLLVDMGFLKQDAAAQEVRIPEVKQFFNRILALDLDRQGIFFNGFMERFERVISAAKAEGTFDEGVEDLKGENIRVKGAPTQVWSDKATGAKTEYLTFQYDTPVKAQTWEELQKTVAPLSDWSWARSKKTGALVAVRPWSSRTETHTGRMVTRIYMERPRTSSSGPLDREEFDEKYDLLTRPSEAEMEREWRAAVAEVPKWSTHELHMLSGVVLPIWGRVVGVSGKAPKVNRVVTKSGERYVGIVLPHARVRTVLRDLGVGVEAVDPNEAWNRVMAEGDDLKLAGGLTLKRRRWQGEQVAEVVYATAEPLPKLKDLGFQPIQDNTWKWRYFLPTDETRGKALLARVLNDFPVIEEEGIAIPHTPVQARAEPSGQTAPATGALAQLQRSIESGETFPGNLTPEQMRQAPEAGRKGGQASSPTPAAGGGGSGQGVPPGVPPSPAMPEDDGSPRRDGEPGEYDNPDLREWEEQNFRASMKPEEGLLARAKQQLAELGHFLTRSLRDLQRGKYPTIETMILQARRGTEIGQQLAHVHIAKILTGLTGRKQRTVRRTLYRAFVVRDLHADMLKQQEQVANGERDAVVLPDPWTEAEVARQYRLMNEDLATNYPDLLEIVERRTQMNDALYDALLAEQQKALGRRVGEKRTDYYRRLIIDEFAKGALGRDRTSMKAPKLSFQRARKGSLKGFEQDYVLAEWDWVSKLHRALILYRLLNEVKQFDIYRELKLLAMDLNDEAARGDLLKLAAAPDIDAARGVTKGAALRLLTRLADEGSLPDTVGGEWESVLTRLADVKDAPEALLGFDWPDVQQYLKWLLKERATEAGAGPSAILLRGIKADAERMKRQLGAVKVKWDDLVPEGHAVWQMADSPLYETLDRKPDDLADDALEAALGEKRQRRSGFLVIPEDLAKTLAREGRGRADAPENQFLREWNRWVRGPWVQNALFGPLRVVAGTLRDWSGHIDASLTGNPEVLKTLPRAFQEVVDVYVRKAAPSPELEAAIGKGLFVGTFTNVEAGSVVAKRLNLLGDALPKSTDPLAARAVLGYLKAAQLPREMVENIVTYAHLLSFERQIQASPTGEPKSFGATRPRTAMGIQDEGLRAWRLARDLMGNFDDQPEVIQALRTIGSPFIRWASANFSRWAGMYRNVWTDPRHARRMSVRLIGKGVFGTGVFAVKAAALNAMLNAWNNARFPEEEKRLRRDLRGRLHVILGYHPRTGELMVLRNLGSWEDALSWFGMDQWRAHLEDYLNGKRTAEEVGVAIARQGASNVIGAVKPVEIGAVGEALAGKSLFPDAFKPRPIRDRLAHGLGGFGVGSVLKDVREMTGIPDQARSVMNRFFGIPAADLDRDEYQTVKQDVREFLEKKGKPVSSELGKAELWEFRNAIRWKDASKMRAALRAYGEGTGTPKGALEAVERTSPLAMLPPGRDRKEWVERLNREDQARLIRAMAWWRKSFAPNAPAIERGTLPLFNWLNAQEGQVVAELKRQTMALLREDRALLQEMRENAPPRRRRGRARRR